MGDLMLRWVKLSLVALVACGFIGMVVYALWMRDEIRSARVEPALISPPDTPLKRRPDEPGGMTIPNRDKMIFDLLDEASTGVSAPAPAPVAGTVAELPLAGAATPTVVVTLTTAPASPTQVAVASAPVARSAPQPEVKDVKVAAPTQVAAVQPVAQPAPKPVETPKPAATAAATGGWGVQVAAVSSQADAHKMGQSLQAKFAALKGYSIVTPSAGNGKWRVQFGGMASKAVATKVCGQLAGKQPCFPVSIK